MSAYEVTANFMAMDGISDVVGAIGQNVANFGSTIGDITEGMGGAMSAFGGVIEGVFGAFGPLLQTGVEEFLETGDAMAGMAARTGALPETLAYYKQFAENLEATGLVKNFTEAAKAVENLNKRVSGLGDHNTDEFLRQAAGVGMAWGLSADQMVTATGKIQDKFTELEGKPIEALDLLTATAQKSSVPLDVINQVVDKYGGKFQAAGLSAMDMGNLIVESSLKTAPQLGAMATGIEAFHQKIAQPDAKFNAALRDLGLASVADDLKKNKITMDQALEAVFAKFEKMGPSTRATNDAIALFGPSVEKMGGTEVLAKLAGFSNALGGDKGIAGAAKLAADTMEALPSTSFTKVKTGIENFLGGIVESAATALLQLPIVALWIVNQAANTVRTFLLGVVGIIKMGIDKAVSVVGEAWETLKKGITIAAVGIKQAIETYTAPIVNALNGVLKIINDILAGLGIIGKSGTPGVGGPGGPNVNQPFGPPKHAWGGTMDRGWNLLGENGPELANSVTGEVLTNRETNNLLNQLMSGSGGGGGSKSEIHLHTDGATIVDMQAFMRIVYVAQQAERARRGEIS